MSHDLLLFLSFHAHFITLSMNSQAFWFVSIIFCYFHPQGHFSLDDKSNFAALWMMNDECKMGKITNRTVFIAPWLFESNCLCVHQFDSILSCTFLLLPPLISLQQQKSILFTAFKDISSQEAQELESHWSVNGKMLDKSVIITGSQSINV